MLAEYKPTVAVDFDGVIHRYSKGWQDGTIYDPPVPGALEALKELKAAGYRLILFTTRASDSQQAVALFGWLDEHGLRDLFDKVTTVKPAAIAYIDDRAIQFTGDWLQAVAEVDLLRADGTWQARLDAAVSGDPAPDARHAARVLRHLPELLADTRTRRGLTMDQVDEQTGVDKATQSRMEHGLVQPTVATALKLLDWIGGDGRG